MKKITLFILAIFTVGLIQAQVGVGTITPNSNAQLDVTSTDKGVLLPRLDQTQVDALATALTTASEPAGMLIENTSVPCIQRWNGTIFQCLQVVIGGASGNDGSVKVNTESDGGGGQQPITLSLAKSGSSFGPFVPIRPVAPLGLASAPTTTWPKNNDSTDADIFDPTLGGGTGRWLENPVAGQVHIWRVEGTYTKGNAADAILESRLRNTISGFELTNLQVFGAGETTGQLQFLFITIADNASIGVGYEIDVRAQETTTFVIGSVTRISLAKQ